MDTGELKAQEELNNQEFFSEEQERLIEERIRKLRREGISLAKVNRHTGEPHEHKREIARRLRQQAKN
jgi:DNA-binding transcriptional MerR regulator